MIEASAPGKVVLSGEYAVLNGAPAVSMAVNRRAIVSLTATSANYHQVTAPGYTDEPCRFVASDGVIDWLDSSATFGLLERVWRVSGVDREYGLDLRLDTSGFVDSVSGNKTGIGSSAALSVALAYALHELGSQENDPLEAAHQGHLDFQGGRGSGVDIATSAAGALVVYRMSGRAVTPIAWPDRLQCRFIWSGSPASTDSKLHRFDRGGPQPSRDRLDEAASHMAATWQAGSAEPLLREYRKYLRVLQEFSDDYELDIFGAGHAELAALAQADGLVYKPCGAGGGDIGILLSDDPEHADAFMENSLPGEFSALDLHMDTRGVTLAGGPV